MWIRVHHGVVLLTAECRNNFQVGKPLHILSWIQKTLYVGFGIQTHEFKVTRWWYFKTRLDHHINPQPLFKPVTRTQYRTSITKQLNVFYMFYYILIACTKKIKTNCNNQSNVKYNLDFQKTLASFLVFLFADDLHIIREFKFPRK